MQGLLHAAQKIKNTLVLFVAAQTQRAQHWGIIKQNKRLSVYLRFYLRIFYYKA